MRPFFRNTTEAFWSLLLPAAIGLWATALIVSYAFGHDHGQFGQYSQARDQWLQHQTNPKTKIHCCVEADANLVEQDIRDGHYWVRWAQFDWVQVPDEAVLPFPNPTGEPVVWWMPF